MASIYKRGRRWWINYRVNGRLVQQSLGVRTKFAAQSLLEEMEKKHTAERFDLAKSEESVKMLIEDYVANLGKMVEKGRIKTTTFNLYKHHVTLFRDWGPLGSLKCSQIRPALIDDYIINRKRQGLTNAASLNNELRSLRTMFLYGVREQYLSRSPIGKGKAEFIPENRDEKIIPTENEMREIIKASGEYKDVVVFLLNTGLRASEFCSLTTSNYNREKRMITVCSDNAKTRRERHIPIRPGIAAMVEAHLNGGATLFYTPRGKEWKKWHLSHVVEKIGKKVGLNYGLHPHMLRSYYCSFLLAENVNIKAVQELLGHTDYSTTMKYYARVMKDRIQSTIDAVPLPSLS